MARTVAHFPALFSASEKANIIKSMRWWKDKEIILHEEEYAYLSHLATRRQRGSSVESALINAGRRKFLSKVRKGRGRKMESWDIALQDALRV